MATYNRNGAIEYARTWWNGHNPAYPDYDNDGSSSTSDCANFVSLFTPVLRSSQSGEG